MLLKSFVVKGWNKFTPVLWKGYFSYWSYYVSVMGACTKTSMMKTNLNWNFKNKATVSLLDNSAAFFSVWVKFYKLKAPQDWKEREEGEEQGKLGVEVSGGGNGQ